MPAYKIRSPKALQILDKDAVYFGANQEWFTVDWQRKAGCGPTTCSMLVRYLAATRPAIGNTLPNAASGGRDAAVALMGRVWQHMTPGYLGVNTARFFCRGAEGFIQAERLPLECHSIALPPLAGKRKQAEGFITEALAQDLPVAFLCRSKGKEQVLDTWHWTTITAFDSDTGRTTIYDNGSQKQFSMPLWLQTSRMGGGFAYLAPLGN